MENGSTQLFAVEGKTLREVFRFRSVSVVDPGPAAPESAMRKNEAVAGAGRRNGIATLITDERSDGGSPTNPAFVDSMLDATDRANVAAILAEQKRRR